MVFLVTDTVQLAIVEKDHFPLNTTVYSCPQLKFTAKRYWFGIQNLVTKALLRIDDPNNCTAMYNGYPREFFLERYEAGRLVYRSLMKKLGEDEAITVAQEKDLSNLKFEQFHRCDCIGGIYNPNAKNRETTQTLFGNYESMTTSILCPHEEDAGCGKSSKKLEQRVGIENKNNVRSSTISVEKEVKAAMES